jgi:hypothetical protein
MHLDLHITILAAVSCGIGYLMIVAGLHKGALEPKRRERLCPSCGRIIKTRVCTTCTG